MATENKLRDELSAQFIAALKADKLPWHAVWQQRTPINGATGKRYRGVNTINLSIFGELKGYTDPRWCTFQQAKDKGWHICKGEKSVLVEYWAYYDKQMHKLLPWAEAQRIQREDPERARKDLFLSVRCSPVFNAEQMDGVPELPQLPETDIGVICGQRDTLLKNMAVGYKEEGVRAYYSPGRDTVVLPPATTFEDVYGYMCTLLHECGHATGHESRLNRSMSGGFGSPEYAREELRAEIASGFVAQELGLSMPEKTLEEHFKLHKAYIQSWIGVLEEKPEELYAAIKDAGAIADYLVERGEFTHAIEMDHVANDIDAALDGTKDFSQTRVVLGKTPDNLAKYGFDINLPLVVKSGKLRKVHEEDQDVGANRHNLSREILKSLPDAVADPAMVMVSHTRPHDSIVVVSDMLDQQGRPVILAIQANVTAKVNNVSVLTNSLNSAYGRNGFDLFIQHALEENRILYVGEKISHQILQSPQLQLLSGLQSGDYVDNVAQFRANVNTENLEVQEADNTKDREPVLLPEDPQQQEYRVAVLFPNQAEPVIRMAKAASEAELMQSIAAFTDAGATLVSIEPTAGKEKDPAPMTLDEFLGKRGLSSPVSDWNLDKTRLPHGETQRQHDKRLKDGITAEKDYQSRRAAAIEEYQAAVASGEIRDKTILEQRMETARGHEDNESTQAARRLLQKMNINWQTGEPIVREPEPKKEIAQHLNKSQRHKTEAAVYIKPELVALAKEQDVLDILKRAGEPLTLKNNEYRSREHDSLLITEGKGFYWFSQHKGSNSAIDYFMWTQGMTFQDATKKVLDVMNVDYGHENVVQHRADERRDQRIDHAFTLPDRAENDKRAYAYLVGTRKLDKCLVSDLMKQGAVYQSKDYGNVVFVGHDYAGRPASAFKRSTISNPAAGEYVRSDENGSRKEYRFRIENPASKVVNVFEAEIDLLSYLSMRPAADRSENYIALGGVSDKALMAFLVNRDIDHINICTDNDPAGNNFAAEIFDKLKDTYTVTREKPLLKDFNQDLVEQHRHDKAEAESFSFSKSDSAYSY